MGFEPHGGPPGGPVLDFHHGRGGFGGGPPYNNMGPGESFGGGGGGDFGGHGNEPPFGGGGGGPMPPFGGGFNGPPPHNGRANGNGRYGPAGNGGPMGGMPPQGGRGPPMGNSGMKSGDGGSKSGGRNQRDDSSHTPGVSLLVRNISSDITTDDLQRAFGRIGEIRDVYIPRDYHSQQPKGFAFIEFATHSQAREARDEMDKFSMKGRELEVVFAQERRKTPQEMRGRVVDGSDDGSRNGDDVGMMRGGGGIPNGGPMCQGPMGGRGRANSFERSSSFERHKQKERERERSERNHPNDNDNMPRNNSNRMDDHGYRP